MTPTQFWLIVGTFLLLVVGWFAAARTYAAIQRRRNIAAASREQAQPDPDDLDAKWAAYWHKRDLEFRASDLWRRLHEDEAALLAEKEQEQTAALDKVERRVSERASRAVDRGVKRLGYASVVDMFAQWVYARRRSVKRMVAVLDKTDTWPEEWRRQLAVLLDEGAVARAPKEWKP